MNKADLERALKKTVGAALKPVVFRDVETGRVFNLSSVVYDTETNRVHINGYSPNSDSDVAS